MDFEPKKVIQECIVSFETENGLTDIWRSPLMAALSVDNPMIPELRKAVSQDHLLPGELLTGAKSIIVYFIPFENRIVKSNLIGEAASEDWAAAYIHTNRLIDFINEELTKCLNRQGYQAAKTKATHNFDEKTLMSSWSHRHIAWLAGLGSFGLNNMLITSFGCCGRLGSIITNLETSELSGISIKTVSGPEKCLYKINGSCGLCRKKCPDLAIGEGGNFNRHKCYQVCLRNAEKNKDIGFADVCGKCLLGLPCSDRDPSSTMHNVSSVY